ncbi:MAG: carboxylate--amine ligase, partial [Vicinamibacterales bacterium]
RGLAAVRDTCEALALPYRFFGFDSDMSDVIGYAKKVNEWMKAGGREQIAANLKGAERAAA